LPESTIEINTIILHREILINSSRLIEHCDTMVIPDHVSEHPGLLPGVQGWTKAGLCHAHGAELDTDELLQKPALRVTSRDSNGSAGTASAYGTLSSCERCFQSLQSTHGSSCVWEHRLRPPRWLCPRRPGFCWLWFHRKAPTCLQTQAGQENSTDAFILYVKGRII